MLSEAMVRHIVGPEGARALIEITLGAWQDHVDEQRPRFHRSMRAAVVWDYMVTRANEHLCAMDGVRRDERHERPLYILRETVMIRPKMHDRQLLTRNYPTSAQRHVRRSGYFPELHLPNVMFGYKLDKAEAGVEQCVITSPADEWIIDLHDLAAGNVAAMTSMINLPDLDAPWRALDAIRFPSTGS
ncbi:MAG: hypothetical protein ACRCYU_06715 [Nocardioides sp.]